MEEKTLFLPELEKDIGHFEFKLTNDYMFRAMCQRNNKALRGLISSLLHIPVKDIHSAVITNPIILGEAYSEKEFRLDVRVELNGHMVINIEMQIRNQHDWPERSTGYLCRVFDNISRGETYADMMPAVHIGILDFTPFPEQPAFYSCNKLMDEKTYHIYSDKFTLNVLDLSKVAMATDEDIEWGLDKWARLFKADTWEEVKMIAVGNEYLTEASNTFYILSADFEIRERARNREEYYRSVKWIEESTKAIEESTKAIEERTKAIEEDEKAIEERTKAIEEDEKALEEKAKTLEEDKSALEEEAKTLEEKAKALEEKAKEIDAEIRLREAEREAGLKIQKGICKLIAAHRRIGSSEAEIKQLIMEDFDLTPDEADGYMCPAVM